MLPLGYPAPGNVVSDPRCIVVTTDKLGVVMMRTKRKLTKAQNAMLVDCLNYGTMMYNHRARKTAMVLAVEGLVHVDHALVPAGDGTFRRGIAVTMTEAAAVTGDDLEIDPDSEFSDWRVWAP